MNGQIGFYDGNNEFKINKPIRLIELFGGYGSQHFALEYLCANFEQWKLCEWAVKSIQAYKDAHFGNDNTDYSKELTKNEIIDYLSNKGISQNYNEPMTYEQIKRLSEDKVRSIYNNIKATHNLVNIQQAHAKDFEIVDVDKYCYVMTYSFPCQDLSKAGLGKGMEKGSGTRSGMLWEVERILDECQEKPQVLLMENVPEVIGSNNIKHFAKWLEKLESLGYHCYWKVLNAKDYGVPQNRERCFMISILGDYYYEFPEKQKIEIKLKDILEDKVDDKYYLSDKLLNFFIENSKNNEEKGNGFRFKPIDKERAEVSKTITTRNGSRMDDNFITEPIACELRCDEGIRTFEDNVMGTLRTIDACGGKHIIEPQLKTQLRIRKLTPRECFRLMGVKDQNFEKIAKNQSNASLYHLAGDSIVVDVLMAIFKQML